MTVTNQNLIQEEIKRRFNSGNVCYHSVQTLLSSRLLSKNLRIRIYKTIIVPVVLYRCETWSLTLSEEHRLRVFENRVLRRIFGPKRDEVMGEWRKMHNEEHCDLYSSPSIIRIIKLRRMRWAGHVARMGRRGTLIDYWWESQRKRDKRDNIRMVGWGDVDWIGLAKDWNRWRALVNSVLNLQVP
jgi:hypothetical protein